MVLLGCGEFADWLFDCARGCVIVVRHFDVPFRNVTDLQVLAHLEIVFYLTLLLTNAERIKV